MKTFIALLLLSTSAFATDFTCTASLDDRELITKTVEITDDETELNLGLYRDVELVGTAILGQVGAYMIFDGVIFGSISMGQASYKMFMIGEGELSLFCRLEDRS